MAMTAQDRESSAFDKLALLSSLALDGQLAVDLDTNDASQGNKNVKSQNSKSVKTSSIHCIKCKKVAKLDGEKGKRAVVCNCCKCRIHMKCANDPPLYKYPAGGWTCNKCRQCQTCGATSAGAGSSSKWMRNFTLCNACGRLYSKGQYCPICHKVYRDSDYKTPMLQCEKCDRWIHAACEGISDEQYGSFEDENASFVCSICKTEASTALHHNEDLHSTSPKNTGENDENDAIVEEDDASENGSQVSANDADLLKELQLDKGRSLASEAAAISKDIRTRSNSKRGDRRNYQRAQTPAVKNSDRSEFENGRVNMNISAVGKLPTNDDHQQKEESKGLDTMGHNMLKEEQVSQPKAMQYGEVPNTMSDPRENNGKQEMPSLFPLTFPINGLPQSMVGSSIPVQPGTGIPYLHAPMMGSLAGNIFQDRTFRYKEHECTLPPFRTPLYPEGFFPFAPPFGGGPRQGRSRRRPPRRLSQTEMDVYIERNKELFNKIQQQLVANSKTQFPLENASPGPHQRDVGPATPGTLEDQASHLNTAAQNKGSKNEDTVTIGANGERANEENATQAAHDKGPVAESAMNLNPMFHNVQQGNMLSMLQRPVNPSVFTDIPQNAHLRSLQFPAQLYMAYMSMIQAANSRGLNDHPSGNFPNQDQRVQSHDRHEASIEGDKIDGKIDSSKGINRMTPRMSEKLNSVIAPAQIDGNRCDHVFPNTVSAANSLAVLRAVLTANPIASKALVVYKRIQERMNNRQKTAVESRELGHGSASFNATQIQAYTHGHNQLERTACSNNQQRENDGRISSSGVQTVPRPDDERLNSSTDAPLPQTHKQPYHLQQKSGMQKIGKDQIANSDSKVELSAHADSEWKRIAKPHPTENQKKRPLQDEDDQSHPIESKKGRNDSQNDDVGNCQDEKHGSRIENERRDDPESKSHAEIDDRELQDADTMVNEKTPSPNLKDKISSDTPDHATTVADNPNENDCTRITEVDVTNTHSPTPKDSNREHTRGDLSGSLEAPEKPHIIQREKLDTELSPVKQDRKEGQDFSVVDNKVESLQSVSAKHEESAISSDCVKLNSVGCEPAQPRESEAFTQGCARTSIFVRSRSSRTGNGRAAKDFDSLKI